MQANQTARKRILSLCGSTREHSTNHHLLHALAAVAKNDLDLTIFESIANLPHFNPDNSNETDWVEVRRFKELLNCSDGVIICTPEYAHGVPGTLKNALDWTVSSSDFSGKPTVLITASTDGRFGHAALLETLRVIEAKNIDELHLLISFAKTKINSESKITDAKTATEVTQLMHRFVETLHEKAGAS